MTNSIIRFAPPRSKSAGFSIVELVVVVAVILLLSAIAMPGALATLRAYRLTGSARAVAHQVSLARLRAETEFTNAQLVIDPATNTYSLQVCTVVGGKADNCTTPADYNNESGIQPLSQGISFGFGAAAGPAGGQAAMQQTLQTRFNSRGIPVLLDGSGNTNPNDVIYLTDAQGNAFAVGVTVGGHVRVYQYTGGAWKQR
jgi:Tfp pilus assembly protein FimT